MQTSKAALSILSLLLAESVSGQTPVEIQKLSDPTGLRQGYSTSLAINATENLLLVGAPASQLGGDVYAYTKGAAGSFMESQDLVASDASGCSLFGISVAISGTTAVVGAQDWPGGCGIGGQGKAYVFSYSNGVWTETANLTGLGDGSAALFGAAVAIDGTTIVVGAPSFGSGEGKVHVFELQGGTAWVETQTLAAGISTPSDTFGQSVAISGDNLIIGMSHSSSSGPGAIDLYARAGHVWTRTTSFFGNGSDDFGRSVSILGNTAAIGIPAATVNGHAQQGAVEILRYTGGAWVNSQTASASSGAAGDRLGHAVVLAQGGSSYNAVLLAGAPDATIGGVVNEGAAYVFFDTGTVFSSGPRLLSGEVNPAGTFFGGAVGAAVGFSTQMPITPTYFVGATGAPGGPGGRGIVDVFH